MSEPNAAALSRLASTLDVAPEPPEPEVTTLEAAAQRAKFKCDAARAIYRVARSVARRAELRMNQHEADLDALNEAMRLLERSVSNPELHANEVAELEGLAADVALELTSESEFDADDGDAVVDEDDEQDDDGEDDQVEAE